MKKFIHKLLKEEWLLSFELKRISKAIAKERKTAKTSEERANVHLNYEFDYRSASDRLQDIASTKLYKQARKYRIPFPKPPWGKEKDEFELWESSQFTGGYHLTDKGHTELNKRLRKEKRERVDMYSLWVPVISTLAALVGASAAFLALSKDIIVIWLQKSG